MRLTESDLRFVVETVATRRPDTEHVMDLVRGKDDLIEPLLEDPRLAERLISDREAFVQVSPYLLFAVLLRRVRQELEQRAFVMDRDESGRRLPVFEAPRAGRLLGDPVVREYLIELLCSFVRTRTGVVYWRERGGWRQRRFSDLDLDDLIALCQLAEPAYKPALYRRIAELALFLAGVFPDHAWWPQRRGRAFRTHRRSLAEYEQEGQRFYSLAAREGAPPWPPEIYERLAGEFTLAREALNTLSDRYLQPLRERFFQAPGG